MSKQYTREHEWIEDRGDGHCRIGITPFAQEQLGDVVSVELPDVGQQVRAGEDCAVIESVKAASDIYAPADGEVIAVNESLFDNPALINEAPEDDGWLWEMRAEMPSDLMDAEAYAAFVESQQ